MITPQQEAHFGTFGYLLLPRLFSLVETAQFTRSAEEIWAEDQESEKSGERRLRYFVERRSDLHRLVSDDRIYLAIATLLGPEFIWVGSEGNISNRGEVGWHPDRKYYRRGEEHWIDFPQLKIMMYLEKVTRKTGCLRVIPGSHRMPLHKDLEKLEVEPASRPFGIDGAEIPCAALETEPGDVILFNHCIWHAAYGGLEGRSYIALKFAARPFAEDHLKSLARYTPGVFQPHEGFLNSDDPRLQSIVKDHALFATGRIRN